MEPNLKSQRIGEILLEHGLIKKKELVEALEIQKQKGGLIGAILVNSGFVKEEDLAFALANQFNYPYLSLENVTVNRNLCKELGKEFLLENCFIPIEKTRDILTIAAVDPSDEETLAKIKAKIGMNVLAFVAGAKQIEEMIQRIFGAAVKEEVSKSDAILKKATEEKLRKKKL